MKMVEIDRNGSIYECSLQNSLCYGSNNISVSTASSIETIKDLVRFDISIESNNSWAKGNFDNLEEAEKDILSRLKKIVFTTIDGKSYFNASALAFNDSTYVVDIFLDVVYSKSDPLPLILELVHFMLSDIKAPEVEKVVNGAAMCKDPLIFNSIFELNFVPKIDLQGLEEGFGFKQVVSYKSNTEDGALLKEITQLSKEPLSVIDIQQPRK